MPSFASLEELKDWWDNKSSWAERAALARVKYLNKLVSTNRGPKRPEALADCAFEDLDFDVKQKLFN